MDFSLTTLGTASAVPTKDNFSSAHVLNVRGRLFLIDCCEGCQMLLRRNGISHAKIDNIFITHIHGDHVFGLMPLLSTMALQGRVAPLYIFAPPAFSHILKFFKMYFGDGVQFDIIFTPLSSTEPQTIIESRNFIVQTFPLNHKIETYGFLFKETEPLLNVHKWKVEADNLSLHEIALLKQGQNVFREDGSLLDVNDFTYKPYTPRSAAFCSDTAVFEELPTLIAGVDLLYHEATFGSDMQDKAAKYFHSTSVDAAIVAKKAGAKKLVIGHFSSRCEDTNILLAQARAIFPETYLSKEGMVFDIPLQKNS